MAPPNAQTILEEEVDPQDEGGSSSPNPPSASKKCSSLASLTHNFSFPPAGKLPNIFADANLLDKYNAYLESKPVLTKALTAATVQGLGAALGSLLTSRKRNSSNTMGEGTHESRRSRIDWLGVFAFALHGGLLNGPIGHYWFEWLEANGPKSKSKSVLLDQLCVQPPLLFVMFVFLDMVKAALQEIKPSASRTLTTIGPTIVSSWRFWPLAVWATFKYLKKKHYTVALNLCSIAWTVYLSTGKGDEATA